MIHAALTDSMPVRKLLAHAPDDSFKQCPHYMHNACVSVNSNDEVRNSHNHCLNQYVESGLGKDKKTATKKCLEEIQPLTMVCLCVYISSKTKGII